MVVELSKEVRKVLRKAPKHIVSKLKVWVDLVENEGIEIARQIPGFNDEALTGKLSGRRSIRLSRQWRAIYKVQNKDIDFLLVEKVSPHEYKK